MKQTAFHDYNRARRILLAVPNAGLLDQWTAVAAYTCTHVNSDDAVAMSFVKVFNWDRE